MQCILGPFGPKINCRIFGLSVSFPPKVKFLDETLVRYSFVCESLTHHQQSLAVLLILMYLEYCELSTFGFLTIVCPY